MLSAAVYLTQHGAVESVGVYSAYRAVVRLLLQGAQAGVARYFLGSTNAAHRCNAAATVRPVNKAAKVVICLIYRVGLSMLPGFAVLGCAGGIP
ncbi:MAG TPA: hypothetical protein VGS41_16860 [Chthonomonadales bacterium]|nr:hypothetical protein [Chthonomonadales bacterium]